MIEKKCNDCGSSKITKGQIHINFATGGHIPLLQIEGFACLKCGNLQLAVKLGQYHQYRDEKYNRLRRYLEVVFSEDTPPERVSFQQAAQGSGWGEIEIKMELDDFLKENPKFIGKIGD